MLVAGVLTALLLAVTVWWDGRPLDCVIDTGSSVTILSQGAARDVQHALRFFDNPVMIRTVTGEPVRARAALATHVGTQHLGWVEAPVLIVPDDMWAAPRSCLIGNDLLHQHSPLVFDWARQEVRPAARAE